MSGIATAPISEADRSDPGKSTSPDSRLPRVLLVTTGLDDSREMMNDLVVAMMDYRTYAGVPRFWVNLERLMRFDFYLAWRARKVASQYDIVWAGSEKVAVPLAMMGIPKPLVVNLHYPQSPPRAMLLKMLDIGNRWAAVGYVSSADRDFLISRCGYPKHRLFPIFGIKLDKFLPLSESRTGPIMSLGVAERDYRTLIDALATLEGYDTDIYVSSRYGDKYRGHFPSEGVPPWVHIRGPVSDQGLVERYRQSRFVVVALEDTRHSSAGASVILEASASGKAVIATRTLGTASYIDDGATGLLVPPRDAGALRAAIARLWSEPEYALELGRNGRRFVETHFDPKVIGKDIYQMFCSL